MVTLYGGLTMSGMNQDERLDSMLREARTKPDPGDLDRLWLKIEGQLERPARHSLLRKLERGGLFRVKILAAAACLLLTFYVIGILANFSNEAKSYLAASAQRNVGDGAYIENKPLVISCNITKDEEASAKTHRNKPTKKYGYGLLSSRENGGAGWYEGKAADIDRNADNGRDGRNRRLDGLSHPETQNWRAPESTICKLGQNKEASKGKSLKMTTSELEKKISGMESREMALAAGGDADSLTSLKRKGQFKIGGAVDIPVVIANRDPATTNSESLLTLKNNGKLTLGGDVAIDVPMRHKSKPDKKAIIESIRKREDGTEKGISESERHWVLDVDELQITPGDDLVYPEDWDEYTAKRQKNGKQQSPALSAPMQKVIKTAELSLEVEKYETAANRVAVAVTRCRGYYADNRIEKHPDNTRSALIIIRVPQENFETLYGFLKQLGRVCGENTKGEDVTSQYTDLAARIRNKQHLEQRLLAILEEKKRNDKMSEILTVEKEIGRVREEVEKMQGQIRSMDDRISFGTIYLNIAEPRLDIPTGSMAVEIKNARTSVPAFDELVKKLGGEISDRDTKRRDDGSRIITATVKVPLNKFPALVDGISSLGRVAEQNIKDGRPGAEPTKPATGVHASLRVTIFEPQTEKPGGKAKIEVKTLDEASEAISDILKICKASIRTRFENNVSGGAAATYTIVIPRENYAKAVDMLPAVGRIDLKQFTGVDIGLVPEHVRDVPCEMTIEIYERSRQIPTATVNLSTTDLSEAATKIRELLEKVGGRVQTHNETRRPEGDSVASYVLVCRRARFAELVDGIGAAGRIENRDAQGLDLEMTEGAAADVLCQMRVYVSERKAPVPSAHIVLAVKDASATADELKAVRDEFGAKTARRDNTQNADGSVEQIWLLRVPAKNFDKIVGKLTALDKVKEKHIQGIGTGLEDKPDPEALADVLIRFTQRGPYTPSEEETSGPIHEAIRNGWSSVYSSFAIMIQGAITCAPWLLLAGAGFFVVRKFKKKSE